MKQEQTTRSHTARFKARLEAGGEGGAWVILKVPFDVEKWSGSKGRLSVSGTFNGTAYQTSIFPSGDGTHHMLVNKALQLAASAAAGDSVVVTMQPEREPRQVQIPADLQSALEKRPAPFQSQSRKTSATLSAWRSSAGRPLLRSRGRASARVSWKWWSRTTGTPIGPYTVRFEEAVYVLHAFQKKSPSGIRTAKRDVDLVAERLKVAQKDHKEQYGKSKR